MHIRRWRKILLTILAAINVLIMTACTENVNIEKNNGAKEYIFIEDQVFIEPGLSKYDPPIEVSFVRQLSNDFDSLLRYLPGETLENNRWSQLYEQVLGINITYDWTARDDVYQHKLHYAVSSGQIPDITKVNAEQLRELSNAGLIQDLSEVYNDYATTLTRNILSQEGLGPFETATIDGKLMAIPATSASIEETTYIWIRTDWLNNLGLEPPETMDDLLKISKAFVTQDPDRNGLDDTYGLALSRYLWDPVADVKGFMAGYGAFPQLWLKSREGKLVFGGVQPEVKDALHSLQSMYQNGEIDDKFYLKSGSKVKEDITLGNTGIVFGQQWSAFYVQDSRRTNEEAEWKAFSIVSATDDLSQVPLKFNTHEFFVVSKNFKHPEAIVKLFNLHLEKNWGKTADYAKYYSNPFPVWQLSPVTPFPPMKNIKAYRQLTDARKRGNTILLNDEAKNINELIEMYLEGGPEKDMGWGWEKIYGVNGAFSILDQYEENGQLLYDKFTGAPTETMMERKSILDNLMHEAYLKIILGDSIDEYDDFVDMWYKLGGEKVTNEVNEWYLQNQ